MPSELRPVVRKARLRKSARGGFTVHEGTIGATPVMATRLGMGTARAAERTEAVVDAFDPVHVLVVGIAGGLGKGLRIGDLVVADEHVDHDTGTTYHAHPFGGLEPRGRIFTTNELLGDPDIRNREVPDGVAALDMENTGVAAVCERHGVPWTAIRVLSDHVDDDLVDEEVFGLAKPDGSPDAGALARYVLTKPWRIPRLVRLGRDLSRATNAAAGVAIEACRTYDRERGTGG